MQKTVVHSREKSKKKGGDFLLERDAWTGELIGKLHNSKITRRDLARETGFSTGYISMLLNGQRRPPDAREILENAYESIISRRGGQ